jgi:hypothetical protein
MSDYDLLADLREWAESYDAVEIGADGVLYNAINRIERLEKRNKELEEALCDIEDAPMEWSSTALSKMAGAALKGKKDV